MNQFYYLCLVFKPMILMNKLRDQKMKQINRFKNNAKIKVKLKLTNIVINPLNNY